MNISEKILTLVSLIQQSMLEIKVFSGVGFIPSIQAKLTFKKNQNISYQ